MYRKQPPKQPSCFIPGSLSDYIPEDHILKRVNQVLDLRWLGEEVKPCMTKLTAGPASTPNGQYG